jgi:hypothetical protein
MRASSLSSFSMLALSATISARTAARSRVGRRLRIGLAIKLAQRPLKKLDVGLQAARAALHLLLGRADFEAANVLRRCYQPPRASTRGTRVAVKIEALRGASHQMVQRTAAAA